MSVVKLEGGPAASVKPGQKSCVRSSGIAGSPHTVDADERDRSYKNSMKHQQNGSESKYFG
jgi:hypothetical protein